MNYIQKNFHDLFNAANEMNCTYQKPAQCPHCGICCDPLILGSTFISPFTAKPPQFVFLIFQCTAWENFLLLHTKSQTANLIFAV